MIISASALSCDILDLRNEVARLEEAGADALHFDIMDGQYVDNFTFGLQTIESVRNITKLPIEAHLEILHAERHVAGFIEAGADTVIVHSDAVYNPIRVLSSIRSLGARAGYAVNPGDTIGKALEILDYIDMLLIMSVEPGFGGQLFHEKSKDKLKYVAGMDNRKFVIAMDGGIKLDNIGEIAALGVDEAIVGSALFENNAVEQNLPAFRKLLEKQPKRTGFNRHSGYQTATVAHS